MGKFETQRSEANSTLCKRLEFLSSAPDISEHKRLKKVDILRLVKCAEPSLGSESKDSQLELTEINTMAQELKQAFLGDARASNHDVALIDAMVCDYFARKGLLKLARSLAQSAGVEHLVDLTTYEEIRFLQDLMSEDDYSAALQWCQANRSRLARYKVNTRLL